MPIWMFFLEKSAVLLVIFLLVWDWSNERMPEKETDEQGGNA
jgi:hypothetical protein